MIGAVVQLGIHRQICRAERSIFKVRNRQRRPHSHCARRHQVDCAPQAHVLVRGARIPIHPVNAQVLLSRRKCFYSEYIRFARLQKIGHIEVVGAVCAGNCFRVGDPMAVQPYIGSIVEAAEVQPEASVLRLCCRSRKLGAIPPSAAIRAPVRHRQIGEVVPNGVLRPRNLAQVGAEVRLGKGPSGHLCRQDCARHGGLQPSIH